MVLRVDRKKLAQRQTNLWSTDFSEWCTDFFFDEPQLVVMRFLPFASVHATCSSSLSFSHSFVICSDGDSKRREQDLILFDSFRQSAACRRGKERNVWWRKALPHENEERQFHRSDIFLFLSFLCRCGLFFKHSWDYVESVIKPDEIDTFVKGEKKKRLKKNQRLKQLF